MLPVLFLFSQRTLLDLVPQQDVVYLIATVLLSLFLPWIAQWLNEQYKLNGDKAQALAGVLAALFAFTALVLGGKLTAADFTLQSFTATFVAIYGLSQGLYSFVKDRLGWTGK